MARKVGRPRKVDKKKRVTITIDPQIHEQARELLKDDSLSLVIEDYLKALIKQSA